MFCQAADPDVSLLFPRLREIIGRLHPQPHRRAAADKPQSHIRRDRTLNEMMARRQSRDILYWRDKRGHEIDFILTGRRNKPLAIECEWSAADFDATNLHAFRWQYADGDNYVLAQDVDRPFSRSFGEITVRFENLHIFVNTMGLE
jgi:hypothetical protein